MRIVRRIVAICAVATWAAACAQIIGVEDTVEYTGDDDSGTPSGGTAGTGGSTAGGSGGTGGIAGGSAGGSDAGGGTGGTGGTDFDAGVDAAPGPDGAPPPFEVCNGEDDDGDGMTDEDLDGAPCDTGVPGVCADGIQTCVNGSGECVPNTTASPETCNGLDDNCDGEIDNFFRDGGVINDAGLLIIPEGGLLGPLDAGELFVDAAPPGDAGDAGDASVNASDGGDAIPLGDPGSICFTNRRGACGYGTVLCQNAELVCVPFQSYPEFEVCDGIDNDCNGVIDDTSKVNGISCDTGQLGQCSIGLTSCVDGVSNCVQQIAATTELCNGLDDDCDGSTDETAPNSMCAQEFTSAQHVTEWDCVQGNCAITVCENQYFNTNGDVRDGCEATACSDPPYGTTCATATSVTLSSGTPSLSRGGALQSISATSWFSVNFGSFNAGDPDFAPQIALTTNPGNDYQMDIYTSCGASSFDACPRSGGTAHALNNSSNTSDIETWELHYESHAEDCDIPGVENTQINECTTATAPPNPLYVKVTRISTNADLCAGFNVNFNR